MEILSKIIFGYEEVGSAYFCEGNGDNYCGWSFELDDEGTIEIKEFTYNGDYILSEKISVPLEVVEKIKKILLKNRDLIEKLPERIENHSCDGSDNVFNFGDKEISCWNISWHNEKIFDQYEEEKVEIFKQEKQENSVLRIFKSVYRLLKKYGLVVESYSPFCCEWKVDEKNSTDNVRRALAFNRFIEIIDVCR